MKALWESYVSWFLARNGREKAIVAAALVGGIWFLGYTYAIDPVLLKLRRVDRALADSASGAASLTQQAAALRSAPVRDPDALLRAELDQLKLRMADQVVRLQEVERSLVPPQKMSSLLESLLAHSRGLQLISLKNLPPAPLVIEKAAASGATPGVPSAPSAAASSVPGGGLYKHGIELKVAGSYGDLLGYLQQLERAPQRLVWGQMELVTEQYPRSVLTLTVYTLSLETSWLIL